MLGTPPSPMLHLPFFQHRKRGRNHAKNTVETPEKNAGAERRNKGPSVAVSSGGAAAPDLRNIRLIIGREYKNRVTQRSFIITSVILLVIVFLAAFIPTIVQLVTAGCATSFANQVVVVNEAGSVAGLNGGGADLVHRFGTERDDYRKLCSLCD